jgi:hypothetical protein
MKRFAPFCIVIINKFSLIHFSCPALPPVCQVLVSWLSLEKRGMIPGGKEARARFNLDDEGVVTARAVPASLMTGRTVRVPIPHGCWDRHGPRLANLDVFSRASGPIFLRLANLGLAVASANQTGAGGSPLRRR